MPPRRHVSSDSDSDQISERERERERESQNQGDASQVRCVVSCAFSSCVFVVHLELKICPALLHCPVVLQFFVSHTFASNCS